MLFHFFLESFFNRSESEFEAELSVENELCLNAYLNNFVLLWLF